MKRSGFKPPERKRQCANPDCTNTFMRQSTAEKYCPPCRPKFVKQPTRSRTKIKPKRPPRKPSHLNQTDANRETCPEYLNFIRALPCAACMLTSVHWDNEAMRYVFNSQPHHLDTVGSGGSDFTAVPLCYTCHTQWHQLGPVKFDAKFALIHKDHTWSLWQEAHKCLRSWFAMYRDDYVRLMAAWSDEELQDTLADIAA